MGPERGDFCHWASNEGLFGIMPERLPFSSSWFGKSWKVSYRGMEDFEGRRDGSSSSGRLNSEFFSRWVEADADYLVAYFVFI